MTRTIDPYQPRIKIWLVTSLHENGNYNINAVCLNSLRASVYRKTLKNQHGIVDAWIEQSEANHLFGELFKMGQRKTW